MAPLAGRPSRPVLGQRIGRAGWRGQEPTVLFPVAVRFLLLFIFRVPLAAEQDGSSGARQVASGAASCVSSTESRLEVFRGSLPGRQLFSGLKHLLGGESCLWLGPRLTESSAVAAACRQVLPCGPGSRGLHPGGGVPPPGRVPLRPSGPDVAPVSPVNFEALIIAMSVIGGSILLAVAMCCCCCCCGKKRSRKPDRSEEKVMREQEERRIRQEER